MRNLALPGGRRALITMDRAGHPVISAASSCLVGEQVVSRVWHSPPMGRLWQPWPPVSKMRGFSIREPLPGSCHPWGFIVLVCAEARLLTSLQPDPARGAGDGLCSRRSLISPTAGGEKCAPA
ncbi:MAG TPA: hypothetical protein VGF67_30140 [Ktedonobacteraceae bacterium]